MQTLTIIGDIHGYQKYLYKALEKKSDYYIQIGDIGRLSDSWPDNFRFISGNHDNPNECLKHNQYLGRYGYIKDINVFYISGAESYNKLQLVDNEETWENQELSEQEQGECLELYRMSKPRIVISHDCPSSLYRLFFNFHRSNLKTPLFLESLKEIHKPIWWIFGHHHRSIIKTIDSTCYVCLNIAETITLLV